LSSSTGRQTGARVSRRKLVFRAIAFGVGAYLGYQIAYFIDYSSGTSGLGAFGAALLGILVAVILFVLALFAVLAWFTPGRAGRPAARALIAYGALFAGGVGLGWGLTPVLGVGYRPPVTLNAPATITLALEGLDGYTSQRDAVANCESELDKESVAWVQASSVGTVGSATVEVVVTILTSDGRPDVVAVLVPPVQGDTAYPTWQGTSDVLERTEGSRGGRLAFTGTLVAGRDAPGPPGGWPAKVSGTVSWSCGEWT
jgi:hypothetical protein